jgi:tetratricopeptide (TPR) repeat protein
VRASYELIKSLVDLEKLDEAELEYTSFRKDFPKEPLLANLAIVLFNAHGNTIDAIEQEIKALEGDPAKARELREAEGRMRAEIRKTLSFANNYMAVESVPDYGLLRNSSKYAARIKDWKTAEMFLEKILAVYGPKPERQAALDTFIKPELAEIKMEQGKFNEALPLLDDAIKLRPNFLPLYRLKARCLGGWIKLDEGGQMERTQGLQEYQKAYDLLWGTGAPDQRAYRTFVEQKFEKHSFEWYQFQLEMLDMAQKLSTQNSDFKRAVESFHRIAKSTDDFETLKGFGKKGQDLFLLFERLKP